MPSHTELGFFCGFFFLQEFKKPVLSRFMLVGTVAAVGCLQWPAVGTHTYAVHFGQYSSAY